MARGDIEKPMGVAITPDVEIEGLPEVTEPVDELEVVIDDGEEEVLEVEVMEEGFDSNLAEIIADDPELGEEALQTLADELIQLYEADEDSRSDWDHIASQAVDTLGFTIEELDEPFPGACGASHPLLAQAVVKFQAKAFRELFPTGGPARTRIMGIQTTDREQQAKRVREFMNYQTTMQMTEYGPELDRLLFYTALYGSGFKKTYYDAALSRPTSRFIKAQDFIIDYYATDLQTAERYTHVMRLTPNEVKRHELAGMYRQVEEVQPETPELSEADDKHDAIHGRSQPSRDNEPYTLLEMHVNADVPGFEHPEGLQLPYIITIDKTTSRILAIRRNWKEGDDRYTKRVWFTHYCFVPGLGFYGYGYLHLIGGLSRTATSTLRQLVDAGTFANMPAGFKSHGLRVLAPDEPLSPGEWREVNAPAGDLARSLVPAPYKEPSPTLMKLMEFMVSTAKEFADTTDQVVSDSSNYGPVGTTLALLEQSAKLFSAIHTRMHSAQALDLKLLAQLNHEFLPTEYPYDVVGASRQVFKEDFDLNSVDVIPVSDPNMPTEAHRVAKLNAIMQVASQDPAAHNMNAIRLDLYTAMGVDSPERYMAQKAEPFNGDPISENAAAMRGMPITQKLEENHDAHIEAHSMILNNPAYADIPGLRQNMTAHIQAHLADKYRIEMVQMIGDPQIAELVLSGQQLPPDLQAQISVLAAEASDSVLQLDEAKAKAMAGELEDPVIELQRTEQALRKDKQDKDHEIKKEANQLREAEIMIDDLNTDLDREAKVKIARIQADGYKNRF